MFIIAAAAPAVLSPADGVALKYSQKIIEEVKE
jgi:hypothetical protein